MRTGRKGGMQEIESRENEGSREIGIREERRELKEKKGGSWDIENREGSRESGDLEQRREN